MANNKISFGRFFEIGGCCEIKYTIVLNGKHEICYPKKPHEYNIIINNELVRIDSVTFMLDGKGYEPLIEDAQNKFYYLIVSE